MPDSAVPDVDREAFARRAREDGFEPLDATAIDLETGLVQPGLLAPETVVGSAAWVVGGAVHGELVTLERVRADWPTLVDRSRMLIGANIAFDFAVLAAHDIVPIGSIIRAYDEGRVWDVQIAQALHGIAGGHLFRHPRTFQPLQKPGGGGRARYSLETCVDLVLGRSNAKENDYWRSRYAILAEVPLADWPEDARQYPVDDARNTLEVALAQAGAIPRTSGACAGDKPLDNLHDLGRQCRAAFALHLGAVWGIRTDPEAVGKVRANLDEAFAREVAHGQSAGFLRADGTEDQASVKRAIARAFGAEAPCPRCNGTGKVTSAVTGKPVGCKGSDGGCDGTGFDLAKALSVPRTDKGGVKTDRDTLAETGDDVLERYGLITEIEKHRSTYLPALELATTFPMNPRPNALVETGRTSYDGVMQTFPKAGGLRECFTPRPGYVFCSNDYPALELCSLGQALVDLLGRSSIAETINASGDPGALHTALAARMLACDVDDLKARVKAKEPEALAFRQAAKAGNFGFPGGMGAATFVLAKRKRIEGETKSPDGKVTYAGLRFCILMTGAERCGVEKITEHKGRPVPPVCAACVKCAEDLRDQWFRQWQEMRAYFNLVSSIADTGEMVQLRSLRRRGGVDFTNTANGFFQGLAADGAKDALWHVTRECYDPRSALFGSRVPFFAHDELFSEHPEPAAHEAAHRIAEIMRERMQAWLPDVKIPALEPALMRRWSKSAKGVYVAGRLVPDPDV